jgi:hypothetical protein
VAASQKHLPQADDVGVPQLHVIHYLQPGEAREAHKAVSKQQVPVRAGKCAASIQAAWGANPNAPLAPHIC